MKPSWLMKANLLVCRREQVTWHPGEIRSALTTELEDTGNTFAPSEVDK